MFQTTLAEVHHSWYNTEPVHRPPEPIAAFFWGACVWIILICGVIKIFQWLSGPRRH